jgi:hypothetical protein
MLKVTLAAVAAALLTPALAHGATIRGTVAAKQANRHVLVIASRHGSVTSARVSPRRLRRTRLGTRLVVVGSRLPDGSLRVAKMRSLGHARRARLRVVVMKANPRRLLVAGGGSAFAIRLTRGTRRLAGAGGPPPGQEITAEVEFSKDGPLGTTLQPAGQAPLVEFSGTVTALGATSFTVSSDGIATLVALPSGVMLPPLVQVGSEVEVVASISGSTLTLTTVRVDGASGGDNGGTNVDRGGVEAEGFVTALNAGSLTIQPGDNASPVTFGIPAGFALPSGLAVGSVVGARGEIANGVLTLTRIELQNDNAGQREMEAEGAVTAFDTNSITIQSADGGSPTTFAIPAGFTLPKGLGVGSSVNAHGALINGTATLTRIELQSEDGAQAQAEGPVTTLDTGSITIQSGDSANPTTFSIPAGFTIPSGLAAGSLVDAQGEYVNGVLTLTKIELRNDSSS